MHNDLILASVFIVTLATVPALAVDPPSAVDFQGVLKDSNGAPVTGTRDINVLVHSASAGGDEILIDQHTAVPVADGKFTLTIGSGTLVDGSGPGAYTTLADVFADYPEAWMEIEVGQGGFASIFSKLSPRFKPAASAIAYKTKSLGGRLSGALINTSATTQIKLGPLNVSGVVSAPTISGNGASVTGVNAETLDGLDSTAFSPAAHTHDGTMITGTVPHAAVADMAGSVLGRASSPCADTVNRFVDCSNGTISDTVTGLLWLKDANCAALGGAQTFSAANQAAAGLADGSCGLTDNSSPGQWRLPTRDEWGEFTEWATTTGCVPFLSDTSGFGCCSTGPCSFVNWQLSDYWTSTTNSADASQAWSSFLSGGSGFATPAKSTVGLVWPVRSMR